MRVEAGSGGLVLGLAPVLVGRQRRVLLKDVVGYLVHEPVEAFAVELFLDGQLFRDVSVINVSGKRLTSVKVFLVLVVKPSFNHTPKTQKVVDSQSLALF